MAQANGRKSIFITGAASGIGTETARLFAGQGWFCGLYDIDEAGLDGLACELGPDKCHTARLDVTVREDWQSAIEGFGAATGQKMHVLFNNAGIGAGGWFEEVPPETADRLIDTNLKGVVNGVYMAQDLLHATPSAQIINMASIAGAVAVPQLAIYSATKFAVRGLTEALDLEFQGRDIRVKCIMPWFVSTPMLDGPTGQTNTSLREKLVRSGMEIYPVELAAKRVWEAAHGKAIHYTVGKSAGRANRLTRIAPALSRYIMRKGLPKRRKP